MTFPVRINIPNSRLLSMAYRVVPPRSPATTAAADVAAAIAAHVAAADPHRQYSDEVESFFLGGE